MKRKGFTLIELLAVIVVLAIIALIATPQILNVVEKARKGAAKSSALGYIDAVEKQIMVNQLNENPEILDGEYSLPMGNKYKISIKGSKPSSGNMTITKSKVVSATMCINNYTVTYNGKTATVGNKCNGTESTSGSTKDLSDIYSTANVKQLGVLGVAYLDPTDLNKTCNASNSTVGSGKNGCMKFYIYDDSGDTYKMILDHNTTNGVAWNSENINTEMKEVAEQLLIDTNGWVVPSRLITAEEIAAITKNTTWDVTDISDTTGPFIDYNWFCFDTNSHECTAKSQGNSAYAWLYNYTKSCTLSGCDFNNNDVGATGYWTSTPKAGSSKHVWYISYEGRLATNKGNLYNYGTNAEYLGIRPVITISKSIIKN